MSFRSDGGGGTGACGAAYRACAAALALKDGLGSSGWQERGRAPGEGLAWARRCV